MFIIYYFHKEGFYLILQFEGSSTVSGSVLVSSLNHSDSIKLNGVITLAIVFVNKDFPDFGSVVVKKEKKNRIGAKPQNKSTARYSHEQKKLFTKPL